MSGLPLPEGWEAVASEYGSEYVYYWNRYTNETTWERPLVQVKRKWGASASLRPMPSGCFIFPQPAQMPPRRSKMTKSTDVFKVLLARGMPSAVSSGGASKPAPASSRAAAKGGKGKGKGKKGEEAKPQVADAPPVPAAESKEWWRGSPSCHSYLPLDTLVACARVNRAWRTALLDSGFDYGVATFGIAMARWRAKSNEAKPSADVDAPAELSKRLSILLQSQTMASGARLREVRQFLCWHGDINQKNATCLDDPAAKAFLPSVLRETWQRIYDPGFWLALAAVEPVGSYLSDGVKGMMWAFATPAGMPSDYHTIREASDEVHEEDDDQDDDWGEEDMTLTCRECSSDFVFTKGEQIFFRQRGLESKPGRCKQCIAKSKKPRVDAAAAAKGGKSEPKVGAGRGLSIVAKGGGGVGGDSRYKISNREATRDMDWLCAISSMEGTQHKTARRTDPKPKTDD